ncbi:hypothetical protein KC331_g3651 [Hortaea werneckii]|nr:hypothetical protein KC331_g3651 [Hortaea werneckii]KAI7719033.1 hypothetical protein KC353_g3305 [Hortaea werneckii]
MDFPHQRRVAPSNNIDYNQNFFKLYSPPPQGYAPLSSSRGGVPSFLSSDDHNPSLETSSYQSNMFNTSYDLGGAPTTEQPFSPYQAVNSSTRSAINRQASQLADDNLDEEIYNNFIDTSSEFNFNSARNTSTRKAYPAWSVSNQRATPQTIAPAVLEASYPHNELEVAPQGMKRPPQHPEAWPGMQIFTNPALPVIEGNTKRRKVKASFDTGPTQTSTANFTASQQKPSSSAGPMPTASHKVNGTHHGPSNSLGSMPIAEPDFKETHQWDVGRKTSMQNTGSNFTASQQRPSNTMHPAANMPSPSHEQGLNYGSLAYSVAPPFQYQHPTVNHNAQQDVWDASPSGQYGVGLPSASMSPAQPTSRALMPFNQHVNNPSSSPSAGQVFSYKNPDVSVSPRFQYQQPAGSNNTLQNVWSAPSSSQYGAGLPTANMSPAQPTSRALMPLNQHDNVPLPSTSPDQDFTFSYSSSASSPPFNTQQPGEYDIFHQDIWSSPPSDQYGAELPTSSFTTADLTPPDFSQDNQQGNYLSSGPQVNVYQQNNVLSGGVQINQPSNILSGGSQVNQLNNVSSNGPQVNQQGVGSSPANIPSTRPASFVPPQTKQQGDILSSGPQVNQQGTGIPPANMPPAQPASVAPPQVNQQGNALSSGPHVNQQSVGIASANMPPAQAAPVAPPQVNQQSNAPSNGPQANQHNNVAANGQQVNLQRNVVQTPAGINRIDGHNADMKALYAIPPNAALPAMELSLTELLTYFPNHTTWPYVMLRFRAVGARPKKIARGQLLVRGVIHQKATESVDAKIRQQRREAGRLSFGVTSYTSRAAENQLKTLSAGRVSYDVSAYTARIYHQPTVHAKLVDIARGVTRHPGGQDAGIFTQVVQHVLGNLATLADKTTADVVTLAAQHGFNHPAEKATDGWDKKCLKRMMQLLAANGMP